MARSGVSRERQDPARVVFGPDFPGRLERLVARTRSGLGRDAGAAQSRTRGAGDEFLGHRPYRAGEELRHFDWRLLARSDRAFVRVFRREVSERWLIHLDASASMGLGQPGKLQWGAELATGLAVVGLAAGARTRLRIGPRSIELSKLSELGRWLQWLGAARAEGSGESAAGEGEPSARAGRVFFVGDLFDLEPDRVLPLAARGRSVDLVRVLAPRELTPFRATDGSAPGREAAVRWLDPETGEHLGVVDRREITLRYERALERRLSGWDRLARRPGLTHTVWSSAVPFETAVRSVLGELCFG